ncbi:MAG: DUF4363 family protein [Clostridiaceae bacterium]|nr:DUF4363 family protein [Eubacteriales bacterium]
MTSAREFKLANRIAILIVCVFLLSLFIFDRVYVGKLSKDLVSLTEQAEAHVHRGDWAEAGKYVKAVEQRFRETQNVLKLFYDHEDIDTLETEVSTALQLITVREPAEIFLCLENIKSIASYLAGIETFSIPNLF